MANAHLVYDFAQTTESWRHWAWSGLELAPVGLALLVFPNVVVRLKQMTSLSGKTGWKPWSIRVFGGVFLCFSLLWTAGSFGSLDDDYQQLVEARKLHQSSILEGCLNSFHAMPDAGHDEERVGLGGHEFTYSDYIITPTFNKTSSHGGPIQPDSWVHLEYVGNNILSVMISEHACPSATKD